MPFNLDWVVKLILIFHSIYALLKIVIRWKALTKGVSVNCEKYDTFELWKSGFHLLKRDFFLKERLDRFRVFVDLEKYWR